MTRWEVILRGKTKFPSKPVLPYAQTGRSTMQFKEAAVEPRIRNFMARTMFREPFQKLRYDVAVARNHPLVCQVEQSVAEYPLVP